MRLSSTTSASQLPVVADQLADLGVAQDLDVRVALDLVDQVAGHVAAQVVVADQQADPGGVPGEEDGGLAGGVAAADDATGCRSQSRASTKVAA